MEFPVKARPRLCSFKGCNGQVETQTAMQVHLWHWHVWDTMVILEENNLPHLRCPLCDMLVLWRMLSGMHRCIVHCKNQAEWKHWYLEAEKERAVTSGAFIYYGKPLDMVNYF